MTEPSTPIRQLNVTGAILRIPVLNLDLYPGDEVAYEQLIPGCQPVDETSAPAAPVTIAPPPASPPAANPSPPAPVTSTPAPDATPAGPATTTSPVKE